MSNLNPLSFHKDLGLVLGYDDPKNPTKEVIWENISKKKKEYIFPLIYRLILSTIICGLAYNSGLDWYFYASILLLVTGAFVSLKHKSDLEKQFEIADEEIEEPLTVYEEWNNGY